MKGVTFRISTAAILAFPCILCVSATTAKADLTSASGSLTSHAMLAGNATSANHTFSALPYAFTQTAVISETPFFSAAGSDYDFSTLEHDSTFNFLFQHDRDGSANSSAGSNGAVNFTLSNAMNMLFALDGGYDLTGNNAFRMQVMLTDLTSGTTLFSNIQESRATVDQSFVLGLQNGDYANTLFGALSGTLTAGHTFQLTYDYGLSTGLNTTAANAFGFLQLNLRAGIVPTAGASALGALGLLLVGVCTRRIG